MYYAGVDIGAYNVKVMLLDGELRPIAKSGAECGAVYDAAARLALERACCEAGIGVADVADAVRTGIGNTGASDCLGFRKEALVSDITCQARACSTLFPGCRTVIDIGGGSSKVASLDERGLCLRFAYSEKCAAGSGRFMQIVANILEIGVEEIGPLSLLGDEPISFSTGCAVFAESDVITKVGEGVSAANILAGMNLAIASKIASLVKRVGYAPSCVMTGGAALNEGLVNAVGDALGTRPLVPASPEFSCAYGAALAAAAKSKRGL
ncbi:MAG: acyl-CoA dehydratase activase [Clostridia bacterium]|nr:acyl-CoA dehydratase activase [Clostridia bacterium]